MLIIISNPAYFTMQIYGLICSKQLINVWEQSSIISYISQGNQLRRRMNKGKKNVGKGKSMSSANNKLSEDMDNEIKDAFKFYDTENTGYINRKQLRSILGNFGFTKMNGKQIEDEITTLHNDKDSFSLSEVLEMIQKKWFEGRGREDEALDMFTLFDRKEKGLIGLAEIKQTSLLAITIFSNLSKKLTKTKMDIQINKSFSQNLAINEFQKSADDRICHLFRIFIKFMLYFRHKNINQTKKLYQLIFL